jgi:hypothetical protein
MRVRADDQHRRHPRRIGRAFPRANCSGRREVWQTERLGCPSWGVEVCKERVRDSSQTLIDYWLSQRTLTVNNNMLEEARFVAFRAI